MVVALFGKSKKKYRRPARPGTYPGSPRPRGSTIISLIWR